MISKTVKSLSAALALIAPGTALAAAQDAPAAPPPPTQAQADYSQDTLRAFVTAAMGVSEVVAEHQPLLERAETEERIQAIQQEAQDAMAVEVTQAGISVDTYNAIQADASQDPALAQRITALAEDMREVGAEGY